MSILRYFAEKHYDIVRIHQYQQQVGQVTRNNCMGLSYQTIINHKWQLVRFASKKKEHVFPTQPFTNHMGFSANVVSSNGLLRPSPHAKYAEAQPKRSTTRWSGPAERCLKIGDAPKNCCFSLEYGKTIVDYWIFGHQFSDKPTRSSSPKCSKHLPSFTNIHPKHGPVL